MGEDPATPWEDLKKKTRDVLLYGLKSEKVFVDYVTVDGRETGWSIDWEGACEAVMGRYKDSTSDSQREKYEKYFATIPCASCGGKRLKPEILAVTVGGKNIHEVCDMSAADALEFFSNLQLDERQAFIAAAIVKEVRARLQFLVDVGLDYLTLERGTASLSGGEAQQHSLGHADWCWPHGRVVHSGRAVHRPASARQRAPYRHA